MSRKHKDMVLKVRNVYLAHIVKVIALQISAGSHLLHGITQANSHIKYLDLG